MKILVKKNNKMKIRLQLDEYIPLKVRCESEIYELEKEPANYIFYSKGEKSLLEIAIRIQSKLIKYITLVLNEEYYILNKKININDSECVSANLVFVEYEKCQRIKSSRFITNIYEDGLQILLSKDKREKYIKIDNLYVGLSNINEIVEISINQLNENQLLHIENELRFQHDTQ